MADDLGTNGNGSDDFNLDDYVSGWGDTDLVYAPLNLVTKNFREYLPDTIGEGPYSGMYLIPKAWIAPGLWDQVIPYSTGDSGTDALTLPTPEEATAWASGLAPFQISGNLLGMASTPQGFMTSPYMQQAMQAIGRSNLPSSSYADKAITNALYSHALDTSGAWADYMNAVSPWASGYAEYPFNLAGLLGG